MNIDIFEQILNKILAKIYFKMHKIINIDIFEQILNKILAKLYFKMHQIPHFFPGEYAPVARTPLTNSRLQILNAHDQRPYFI